LYARVRERSETMLELKGIAPTQLTHLNALVSSGGSNEEPVLTTKNKKRLSLIEIKELDKINETFPKI
jgi:hypothetical protein